LAMERDATRDLLRNLDRTKENVLTLEKALEEQRALTGETDEKFKEIQFQAGILQQVTIPAGEVGSK